MKRKGLRISVHTAAVMAVLAMVFSMTANHAEPAVLLVDGAVNQEVSVHSPSAPLDYASDPKPLVSRFHDKDLYLVIIRFKVRPGAKYTLYYHVARTLEGYGMLLYGSDPLVSRSGFLGSLNSRGWHYDCPYSAERLNLTISSQSTSPYLYAAIYCHSPNHHIRVLLKNPADRDAVVKAKSPVPGCPHVKIFWGDVWSKPLRLEHLPSQEAATSSWTQAVHQPQKGVLAGSTPLSGSRREPRGLTAWIEYIKSGRPFMVVFDDVGDKFNDEGYTGDYGTDPMGTLKAGETYRVVYQNGKFSCTGFNESYNKPATFTYGGIDPADGLISLWGRVYAFDGLGRVWDQDYGLVGRLRSAD